MNQSSDHSAGRWKLNAISPDLSGEVVEGAGFEPAKAEPTDLQSVPVDRLGTPPRSAVLS